jgi:uncharacterized DUF497 family protein
VLFEWDPHKATENLRRHRISFHEAATVFGDPLSLTFDDPDHSDQEQWYITAKTGKLLLVAHADEGDRIRMISARRMTPREQKQYEEKN